MIKDLVSKNRSYRRFFQEEKIDPESIKNWIDLARLSPSGANLQPLKFIVSHESERNAQIFPHLAWAGYLKDWSGPQEGEKPAAYIIILLDKEVRKDAGCDHGIAAQSILLGAVESGFGGCMIASVKKAALQETLNIPEQYEILLVLALGKPKEVVQIESIGEEGSIKYWRDENMIHHVPKRSLEELIVEDSHS
ncbi:MAG: nitroreductase family protein [Anaerolineaceae bacterium]|nr:nitroreductase family protein [Anaerolineaceae bacterium]